MTQEEKTLLLKDLCARLPYEVMVECSIESGESIDLILSTSHIDELVNNSLIVKPYLRPLDSMTDEEKEKYNKLFTILTSKDCNFGKWLSLENDSKLIDFYNSQHFDYRGLIEKGLALEAPKDMYTI